MENFKEKREEDFRKFLETSKQKNNHKEDSEEKDNLFKMLNGLVECYHKEESEFYKNLIGNVSPKEIQSPDDFFDKVIRPAEKYWNGFIRTEIKNDSNLVFLLNNTTFVKLNFECWIEKIEGVTCCADKSRTILRRLYNYFLTGEEIFFDYSEEYTYHYCKTIFNTHKKIIEHFDSLQDLYYGNPNYYLASISAMLNK